LIGVHITFNGVEYIGSEDVSTILEARTVIADEVNNTSRYYLKNTEDGDILFPKNALFEADIKLTK